MTWKLTEYLQLYFHSKFYIAQVCLFFFINLTRCLLILQMSFKVSFWYILKFFIYLFTYLAVLGLCCSKWAFTACGEQGLTTLHWGARTLGKVTQELWCTGLVAPWHLLGPGINPESPVLAGRFSTTGPPGESQLVVFLIISISQFVFSFLPLFIFCVLWDYSAFLASLIKCLVNPFSPTIFVF